ncbi:MAG TPA: AMP-binding protein [Conexibacter sp.]|nr:AMP-binding protein [Conexibacter sp.]
MNLWDALTREQEGRGTLRCWSGERFETAAWREVVADARRVARALRRRGVGPGSRVATVLSNSPEAVRGVLGVWLAGGTLASLPVPARGMDADDYGEQLRTLVAQLEPSVFAIDADLEALVPAPLGDARIVAWQTLDDASQLDPEPPELDDVAFVQYSSGSTGTPKGCMLTARAIAAQLDIIRALFDGVPGAETVGSWLPLSHDMGLFGTLLYAWAWDHDLVLSSPRRFMVSPRTWFEDLARFGCTQTAGTSSALHFATRAQRSAALPGRLRMRSLVIAAERVEASVLDEALSTFGAAGLAPTALRPAYGLAEATLAVTASSADAPPRVRTVDSAALADGELRAAEGPGTTALVSLGPPCDGVELRFPQPDRVSELHVRTPSMFSGYYADPARTRERLRDGELATRDLGFLHDGELFLVGRTDDVLSIGGRNVCTSEIEAAVSVLDGVRRGCCTIVDLPGRRTPHLAMLVELRDGHAGYETIAVAAARTATAKAGVSLSECVFLERGALPKTPTGKIQRFRCRELLLSGRLPALRRVALAGGATTRASGATGA